MYPPHLLLFPVLVAVHVAAVPNYYPPGTLNQDVGAGYGFVYGYPLCDVRGFNQGNYDMWTYRASGIQSPEWCMHACKQAYLPKKCRSIMYSARFNSCHFLDRTVGFTQLIENTESHYSRWDVDCPLEVQATEHDATDGDVSDTDVVKHAALFRDCRPANLIEHFRDTSPQTYDHYEQHFVTGYHIQGGIDAKYTAGPHATPGTFVTVDFSNDLYTTSLIKRSEIIRSSSQATPTAQPDVISGPVPASTPTSATQPTVTLSPTSFPRPTATAAASLKVLEPRQANLYVVTMGATMVADMGHRGAPPSVTRTANFRVTMLAKEFHKLTNEVAALDGREYYQGEVKDNGHTWHVLQEGVEGFNL